MADRMDAGGRREGRFALSSIGCWSTLRRRQARNLLLLLFVLFENFQTFNSRSEHHSVVRQGFLANRLLVVSVIGAQAFISLRCTFRC